MHFAVDYTLCNRYNNVANISDQVNYELNSVNGWLSANKLYLNSNKTIHIIFSNKYKTSTLNQKSETTFIDKTAAH